MSENTPKQTSSWRMYPSLSLQQAIEKIGLLYAVERRTTVPLDIAMKAMGYKSPSSGPSTSTRSALKQFGLLEESGSGSSRKVGVSGEAYNILEGPEHVKVAAVRAAALRPPTHKMIWEQFGLDTGSDENFAWQLEHEYGFSRSGAIDFVRKYKQTMTFAGVSADHRTSDGTYERGLGEDVDPSPEGVGHAQSSPEVRTVPTATSEVQRSDVHPDAAPTAGRSEASADRVGSPLAVGATRVSRHAIPLIGGKQVILEGEFPLSEQAWEGFMTVLAAFKPGLVAEVSSAQS